jgi:hypothetical protein
MKREALPRALGRKVRNRAGDRCEYCRSPASFSCAPFVCEHALPRVRGAGSGLADLGWACPACNGPKYAKTHALDPQKGRSVPLFNPRRQRGSRPFAWRPGLLMTEGKIATGRLSAVPCFSNSSARASGMRVLGMRLVRSISWLLKRR